MTDKFKQTGPLMATNEFFWMNIIFLSPIAGGVGPNQMQQ
jgi:hypothetical protein